MVSGNTTGLSKQILMMLESLKEIEVPTEDFFSEELAAKMAEITFRINREISVYLNRRGDVLDISVGELNRVSLPYINLRRSRERLNGVRCIHTHPGGSGYLSKVDLNALTSMKFDAMCALGVVDGKVSDSYVALLNPDTEVGEYEILGPFSLDELCQAELMKEIRRRDALIEPPETVQVVDQEEEKAILIGLDNNGEGTISLNELEELAKTAGAKILQKVIQSRKAPEPATYIGRGKASELGLVSKSIGANLAIIDDELTAVQLKNLEDILGIKVIDRTALILDIFAKRAVSREGKLQVELAQLKYRLPRLMGMGVALSRLGGGIGTRGPGERKLETDRRHIRRRINEIENELSKVKDRRSTLRENRTKKGLPVCALVGYTNSGKSTLLNKLTGSSVLAENKLFATLDPVSRGLVLDNNQNILLVDTVGFVNKLPHDLVDAFRSTLEEVVDADLLLHVVDSSSPYLNKHIKVVNQVLRELGANQKIITVFNKIDLLDDDFDLPIIRPCVKISAVNGTGLDELLSLIEENMPKTYKKLKVLIPYDCGGIRSLLHSNSRVLSETFQQDGYAMEVEIPNEFYAKVKEYIIS